MKITRNIIEQQQKLNQTNDNTGKVDRKDGSGKSGIGIKSLPGEDTVELGVAGDINSSESARIAKVAELKELHAQGKLADKYDSKVVSESVADYIEEEIFFEKLGNQ